jgi:hypothetical protein
MYVVIYEDIRYVCMYVHMYILAQNVDQRNWFCMGGKLVNIGHFQKELLT